MTATARAEIGDPTPVGRLTRGVFVAGAALTTGTGIALFAFPGKTAEYWAWTIKAPLTAAFFGSGYIGAATSLWLAARSRVWQRTRIVLVLAFALTSLALLATLRNLGPFAFGTGGVRATVAWVWAAVYVALPPLVLIAFLMQERRGGAREYGGDLVALAASRLALGVAGAASGVVGCALLTGSGWLASRWPWSLPPLPAAVLGAWLCTFAVGSPWFAVRERDWRRARLGALAGTITSLLDLVAAARLEHGFKGSVATALYLGGVGTLLACLLAVGYVEERRLRDGEVAAASAHRRRSGRKRPRAA